MALNDHPDGSREQTPATATDSTRSPGASRSGAQGAGAGTKEHGNATRPGTGSASAEEDVAERAYRLDFGVAKSLRYHAKRRAWCDRWHHIGSASAILSATAAFASVAGQYPEITSWIALAMAGMTATDLVLGFARSAGAHAELYSRFSALAGKIVINPDPTDQDVRQWQVERLRIEADEPTSLNTLNIVCHNEEVAARGLALEEGYKLNVVDRLFANWGSFRSTYSRLHAAT